MAERDSMVKAPQVFGLRSGTYVGTPTSLVKKDWTLLKALGDGTLTVIFKDDVELSFDILAGSDFGIHDIKTITCTGSVLMS